MVYKFYKMSNFFYRKKLTIVAIGIRLIMRLVFSCDIPYKTKIGKGTSFPHHALGVVIHQDVIIGENCKVLQNVSIGGKSGYKKLPHIGKNVIIGANSVILGPIKIGDNAIIGAGSVVLKDVLSGTTVAGNPAKEISSKKKLKKEDDLK